MGEHIGPKYRYEWSESYYTRALREYQDHVQNAKERMPDWLFFGGTGLCIVLVVVSAVVINSTWLVFGFLAISLVILILGLEDSKRIAIQRSALSKALEQEAESFCMHMVRGQTGETVQPKSTPTYLIGISGDMQCYFNLYGTNFAFDCKTKLFWQTDDIDIKAPARSAHLPDVVRQAASSFQARADKLQ